MMHSSSPPASVKHGCRKGVDVIDENFRHFPTFQQHRSKASAIFGLLKGQFKAPSGAIESSDQSFMKALCVLGSC